MLLSQYIYRLFLVKLYFDVGQPISRIWFCIKMLPGQCKTRNFRFVIHT